MLESIPYHGSGLDVIISYQTTQVLDMWRIRRCLNALGITTADGTQVPPGATSRTPPELLTQAYAAYQAMTGGNGTSPS